ncbi:GNAT family N-acetyltransferase [Conexibacter woesei]|uniref:GCN5-related N-acetyltransferase n=1 Tax=Conexibacter woesei (strain DSM 14684 / CCUG 47730 / CIP 108061 / JCM 11494 / NBRC 100937 / ID131577) TaxID=469383 RepID=D3F2X5_CONWI|nr:GNAT family N-acetyltransferase [Conexibacter woesei]ADB54256.1 GCN5-related N-acetyltransferase [Conexibacter woesei DSM 14684]
MGARRTPPGDARFALLGASDVDAAARVANSTIPPSPEAPAESVDGRLARLRARIERARATDQSGAWVAREDGEVVGLALALRSDGVWVLSLLAVSPAAQSGGLGRGLLQRSLTHADGCRGALIASSSDPRAIRVYAGAGFDLRPAMAASGPVDRAAIPAGLDALVRAAGPGDAVGTEPVDAAVRGGTRAAHIVQLLDVPDTRLYLAGRAGEERGYAIGREGRVIAVAATDEAAAQALLWRLLADARGTAMAERITGGQDWAIEVLLRAGLAVGPDGPVFTRGRLGTLRPFLPSGAYL